MSITLYALRLRGDPEVRYIGLTERTPEARHIGHILAARRMPRPTSFANWLMDHDEQIEVISLEVVECAQAAQKRERELIAMFLALNHRLFNRHFVPAERRIASRVNAEAAS